MEHEDGWTGGQQQQLAEQALQGPAGEHRVRAQGGRSKDLQGGHRVRGESQGRGTSGVEWAQGHRGDPGYRVKGWCQGTGSGSGTGPHIMPLH